MRKKLTFLVPGRLDQLTGGYLFDRRVVEGLRDAGRTVDVVELAGRYPMADAAAAEACRAAFAALPDDAAVVIDGLAVPGAAASLAAAAARLRLVGFIHHPLALETGLSPAEHAHFADLEARLLPLCRGAICPSDATARSLVGYGLSPDRIAVVRPGTVKPAEPPAPRPGGAALQLLCVATITPRKGHLLLIEALATLADLDWRLLCIGSLERDPELSTALRASIARHGLGDRVVLAGEWAPERLASAYAAADCFVLASYHEGYGMVFAEALAHGLPIVATTGGAIAETVPSDAALLIPAGDRSGLATALRRVTSDGALRRTLAAAAARAGARLPDWGECVRAWSAAFDRLAG